MPGIDELVRESLRQRAADVEPTPRLWREVQRRTSRRRWLPNVQWVAATGAVVAAALAAVVVLPDIGLSPERIPEIFGGADTESVESAQDDAQILEEDGATSDEDSAADSGAATLDAPQAADAVGVDVAVDGRELVWLAAEGPRVVAELPLAGESRFVAAAVRPASTPEDFTVATLTTAEGMFDVRTARVVDGRVPAELEVLDGDRAVSPAARHVAGPQWSPDGRSLLWLELAGDDVTLRTVGFSDDPGSGEVAGDEAAFSLDIEPDDGYALRPPVEGPAPDTLRLIVTADSTPRYAIELERQADGALALPPDAVTELG